jgi:hypothetical protein
MLLLLLQEQEDAAAVAVAKLGPVLQATVLVVTCRLQLRTVRDLHFSLL